MSNLCDDKKNRGFLSSELQDEFSDVLIDKS